MLLKKLMDKPLPQIPPEIVRALKDNAITGTLYEEKDGILSDGDLQHEVGYKRMEDGSYLVSMICPMPNITPEMIEWWFWWHAQDSLRYQVWFPTEHIRIKYHPKDKDFFKQPACPAFKPNAQFPVERIGGAKMPLRIDFVTPEEFGFSRKRMEENNIPKIVCGHVSALNGLVKHTEMAHIYKQTEDGLLMISRFWLGKTLKSRLLRKFAITENTARGMAEHCCIEYRNLCEILPLLYAEYK